MASTGQERHQRTAVHRAAACLRCAGPPVSQGEDRRCEVDVRDRLADRPPDAALAKALGQADDQRLTQRLLVRKHLAALDAMLTVEEAVVADEDKRRPAELTSIVDCLVDPRDAAIDPRERGQRAAPLRSDPAPAREVESPSSAEELRLVTEVVLVVGRGPRNFRAPEAVDVGRIRLRKRGSVAAAAATGPIADGGVRSPLVDL